MADSETDFIIVGAGAAGCTLARELIERRVGTVLLIESGTAPRAGCLRVPSDYLKAFGSRWDWDHRTLPQKGLGQRIVRLPAGHALGGSTSINAMIWIEPDPRELELWHSEVGFEWSLEHIERAWVRLRAWLNVSHLPSLPPLHPRMQRLLDEASERGWGASGYPLGLDRPRIGIDAYLRMQDRGRRVSLWTLLDRERSGWPPTMRRDLFVLPEMKVSRLLFEGDRAIGVRCMTATGDDIERRARRGVVLCAGAMETPRLLLASGLGPREELQWSGIACRVDLPEMGKDLQDHLVFPLVFRSESTRSDIAQSESDRQRDSRLQYARNRTGPRSSNLAELGGFLPVPEPADSENVSALAQYQLHITPTHYLEPQPFAGRCEHVSFAVTPLRSRSQGNLALAKAEGEWDRESMPPLVIDPNYLAEDFDREDYLSGIESVRGMIARSPWSAWIGKEVFPKVADPDRLASYIQRFGSTIYHYAGSCAMSSRSTSCLNGSMQVRGVDRLWVCDASAMPRLVGCNPQASVAMMAVRLAEMLCYSF